MNLLHQFLHEGFRQSIPVLGEPFVVAGQGVIGFFTQLSSSTEIEEVGWSTPGDWQVVADKQQFTAPPVLRNQVVRNGETFEVMEVKSDLSAYVLTLKKILP